MKEWTILSLLAAGPLLWMIGGTGFKWARRILWPLLVTAGVLIGGVIWWHALLAGLLVAGTAVLPYGERTPFPIKMLVFGSLATPALEINYHLWPAVLVMSAVLTMVFLASEKIQEVTWLIWEGLAGFMQAGLIVMACLFR